MVTSDRKIDYFVQYTKITLRALFIILHDIMRDLSTLKLNIVGLGANLLILGMMFKLQYEGEIEILEII